MDYTDRIERERAEKDEHFANNPRSPIPRDERDDFDGLDYYDPDPAYRFELELREFDDHDTIQVDTTQDGEQTYYRWGEFEFDLHGDTHTLTAYRRDPSEKQLWVPFRDETNGDTTYPAGRYLDLDENAEQDGVWLVDFNRAYSPFCAYSDAYECPLVPFENHLDTRIEAGERYDG